MRLNGIGAFAALTLALIAAPAAVMAAKKPAVDPAAVEAKNRERGMADAPAIIQEGGLACTLSDARWIGADKDADYYEIACNPGFGGVVIKKKDPAVKPALYSCLETGRPAADGKPNQLACKLPGNADPVQALAPLVAKSGVACPIIKARSIGASPSSVFFEVACQDGMGYVLQSSNPVDASKDVKMSSCLQFEPGASLNCELTDRAAMLAVVDRLAAGSGKNCVVKDKRYVLSTVGGSQYYEVACQDGKGYMLEQGSSGELTRTIDCANASFVGGGCTLTDAIAAQSEQAGLYTGLVKKAGFDCDIDVYAVFNVPADQKATIIEAVEVRCKNRPDGAIALFPKSGGNAAIFNCAAAPAMGYRCSKTDATAALPQINKDVAALADKPFTCNVYKTGGLALTPTEVLMEVGCDPEGRFAVAYSRTTGKPVGSRGCNTMGDKCILPAVKK